jgi:hypothetical protein
VFGVEATTILGRVNIDKGIGLSLVGLPDNAINLLVCCLLKITDIARVKDNHKHGSLIYGKKDLPMT